MNADELRNIEFSELPKQPHTKIWIKNGDDRKKELSVVEIVQAAGKVMNESGLLHEGFSPEFIHLVVEMNMDFLSCVLCELFGCRIKIEPEMHDLEDEDEEL